MCLTLFLSFPSSAVKGGGLGLSLHPLSPPNSPSGQAGVVRTHGEGHLGETVFVPDCLADSFETIDRAEMNKYLLPDQGGGGVVTAGGHYAPTPTHVPHAALQPMTTTMSSMTGSSSSSSSSSTSSSSCSASAALTTLPPLGSRLLPSAPVYGSGSPYYTGGASPQPGSHGSPDITADIGGPVPSAGGAVSPGGSPGSPVGEFVELQPPRVPKEEPLPPPLMTPKHSNVTPFLHQNLCYSTQPYTALQYSYPYAAMWH
ncbi:uncharacterized protein [Panulirus ornatus]|uniref:uncharacterized protein n=1 Tax=Panulirus ornatus TaxID=150431 RepID=UPI003A84A9D1